MKRFSIFLIVFLLIFQTLLAQPERDARMKWWREARFGMFIHWGPYSVLGGVYNGHQQRRGGAECIMNGSKIPVT